MLDGLARSGRDWGRFDVTIEGHHPLLPIVAFMMNLRSRITGIATGDQAMFVKREAFLAAGGFPDIPLMEDIALSRHSSAPAARFACASARSLRAGAGRAMACFAPSC